MAYDILVDLDTLFDTRYPIFLGLDCNSTSDSIMFKNYYNRIRDNVNNVSYWIMQAYYRNREKTLLSTALPTGVIGLLKDHLSELKTDMMINEDKHLNFKLYINIYPYMLNKDEMLNLIRYITKMIGYVEIQFIYMNMDDLTPEWILDNVSSYYSYSSPQWLEYHLANLNIIKKPILKVSVFGPAIVTMSSRGTKEEDKYIAMFEERMRVLCDYHAVPLSAFCGMLF